MSALKRRIDELDAVLKKNSLDTGQAEALIAERNRSAGQFNELRKQYDQFAEQARKAGIKITVTQ